LPVALVVATASRTGIAQPLSWHRRHHGVESGGESPTKNSGGHAWKRSGAIPAGGGENAGAGEDGWRTWVGGAAGRWELNFLGPSWAGGNMREASLVLGITLLFLLL
jgi:hypothetical protein